MRLSLVLIASLLLAGCAGTPDAGPTVVAGDTKVSYAFDNRAGLTPDELEVLSTHLDEALGAVRVPPGTAGARHAKITITSYRMLQESGRALVGMVSGTDHIASVIQLSDPGGGPGRDERRVVTRASKTIGTAADMLHRHGRELAERIVGD